MAESISCLLSTGLGWLFKLVKRITCSSLIGVVLPRHCGRTTLCKTLKGRDNSLMVDLDETLYLELSKEDSDRVSAMRDAGKQESVKLVLYPRAKKYVEELKQSFKFTRIILVSSDVGMLRYIGVKEDDIMAFVPATEFSSTVSQRIPDVEERKLFDASRTDILLNLKSKRIHPFNNFDDLSKLVCDLIDLIPRL